MLCPVSDTPLERTGRFAGTGPFLKSLTFQFFKDLPSQFVVFGFHFFMFRLPTRTFLPDLPSDSFTFPFIFIHSIRGTSQGPSWAILAPSSGRPCKNHLPNRTSETYVHNTHPKHVPERNHIPIRHQGVAPCYAATGLDNFRRSSDLHVDVVSSRHWAGELGMGRTGSS